MTNETVDASDFSVYIKNEIVNYRMDTFKAEMWAWAEHVLEKSKEKPYINKEIGKIDEYQDRLVNVQTGLDSYDYFSKFDEISKNLHSKKILLRKIELT